MNVQYFVVPFTLYLLVLFSGIAISAETKKVPTNKATAPSSAIKEDGLIDLNRASKEQLMSVRGINEVDAQKIIEGRPYGSKADLRAKGIISSKVFYKILNKVKVPLEKIERPQPPKAEPDSAPEKKKKSTKN